MEGLSSELVPPDAYTPSVVHLPRSIPKTLAPENATRGSFVSAISPGGPHCHSSAMAGMPVWVHPVGCVASSKFVQ